MKSIQRELTVGILGGTVLALLAAGALLAVLIHQRLVADFDHALEAKARALATLVCDDKQNLEVEFAGEYMPEFETNVNPEYFQFRWRDGTSIERSTRLGDRDLPFDPGAAGRTLFDNLRLPDGRPGRWVQIFIAPRIEKEEENRIAESKFSHPFVAGPETDFVVLGMARSRQGLNQQLLSLFLAIGATNAGLLVFIGLLVPRLIRKGFRPMAALDAQIRQYSPNAVDFRIELPEVPAEIQAIPEALNGLLEKVRASMARERRFSSDVAHELRTPIAELRSACEVGAKWPDDPELVRRLNADTLDAARHLEQIVAHLLELARCDGGRATLNPAAVPVAALIDSCWSRSFPEAREKKLRWDNRIAPRLEVRTDRDKFEMIWRNLVDNAATYSPPGSEIVCDSFVDGSATILRLRNPAANLQPGDVEHVFERFWRKQHLGSDVGHHSGLGLSIVRAFADLLGLDVQVALAPGSIFEVRLSIPAPIVL